MRYARGVGWPLPCGRGSVCGRGFGYSVDERMTTGRKARLRLAFLHNQKERTSGISAPQLPGTSGTHNVIVDGVGGTCQN